MINVKLNFGMERDLITEGYNKRPLRYYMFYFFTVTVLFMLLVFQKYSCFIYFPVRNTNIFFCLPYKNVENTQKAQSKYVICKPATKP